MDLLGKGRSIEGQAYPVRTINDVSVILSARGGPERFFYRMADVILVEELVPVAGGDQVLYGYKLVRIRLRDGYMFMGQIHAAMLE